VNIISYLQSRHNLVLKLLIVLLFSFIIAYLWPAGEVQGHKVGAFNAVWPYSDLIPKKDFYVKKTNPELEKDLKEIEQNAPLFFEENLSEKNEKLKLLESLKTQSPADYYLIKPLFDSIYQVGIIELVTPIPVQNVFILRDNYAEQAYYLNFFTIRSALDFVVEKLNGKHLSAAVSVAEYLTVTYFQNLDKRKFYIESKKEQLSLYKTVVKAGETLVKKGEALTNDKRFVINRYYFSQSTEINSSSLLARWMLAFILLLVLLFYLIFFRKPIFAQNKQVFFLLVTVLFAVMTTYFFHRVGFLFSALPFALVPILVRVFFDSRTALFTHLITLLACSFFISDKIEFLLLQLVAGIGTLFTVAEMRKRQQILNAAVVVFVIYVAVFVSYSVAFHNGVLVRKISSYLPFAVSSMLVLLAYPLIYLCEKIFGFISDFRLLELCDLNQPLLRQLSQDVPGTFQHSMQVANLAEEAIFYIGGNTLLVRAGAMYHDIGKIYNPRFFTENQAEGSSPHSGMNAAESAKIIIGHVIKGIELAKKHKLPEQIIDFIRTHHGTTYTGYFLNAWKKEGKLSGEEENDFRYPGPIPFSKETAVLMMADGVEASSRSLPKKDAISINDLVDQMIDYKISQNQFNNSDITFRDISTIKKVFKKRLMTIYHARIEYPS
jgi:cyclic-di-AMP phosphodiesterase PgpH